MSAVSCSATLTLFVAARSSLPLPPPLARTAAGTHSRYCSPACQQRAWHAQHKFECVISAEMHQMCAQLPAVAQQELALLVRVALKSMATSPAPPSGAASNQSAAEERDGAGGREKEGEEGKEGQGAEIAGGGGGGGQGGEDGGGGGGAEYVTGYVAFWHKTLHPNLNPTPYTLNLNPRPKP